MTLTTGCTRGFSSMLTHAIAALDLQNNIARYSQVGWLYGLSFLWTGLGAFLCYRQLRPHNERSFGDFLAFVFPKRVIFHRSARLDICFVVVRRLMQPFAVAPFVFSAAVLGSWIAGTFAAAFGPPMPVRPSVAPAAVLTLLLLLANDFAYFLVHYLQHRIPFLWEFHKVHHSAPVLIPPTSRRLHPVDDIGRGLFSGLGTAAVSGVFLYLYPVGVTEVTVAGMDAYILLELLVFHNLRHSHLPMRFSPILESIVISPAMHQLHHSNNSRHHDRNFGFLFAIWDRLFGTLMLPDAEPVCELGLSNGEHLAYNSLWALYSLPFVKLFRGYAARWTGRDGQAAA